MGPLTGRERLVLTVGQVWRENFLRKGLKPFVEAAKFLPDMQFIHVGKWVDDSIDDLRAIATSNVQFAGFVADNDLALLCQRAWVYVQASLHEGFGMSLAEAMSAGCIPVATRAGSLPEVVGDCGVYARSNSPEDVAAAIREAFERDGAQRQQIRDRILTEFSIERRRQALQALVQSLIDRDTH
jgi:glycosyltransferase involved in cell wall biosynthesis